MYALSRIGAAQPAAQEFLQALLDWAHIAARHKLAMADASIYAMAREFDATFWTQDADCLGLDGVRYLPKPGA